MRLEQVVADHALGARLTARQAGRFAFYSRDNRFVLIPTLVGLFFAVDMIKAARARLRDNPAPRRPDARRLSAGAERPA